jgi:hypothetical protein
VVVVAGGVKRPEVLVRARAELGDPRGRVRRNAYHAARRLEATAAADLVEAVERIAVEQAAAALDRVARLAEEEGGAVGACAVVVGASAELPLETILRSHALVHAAEGRLYQRALLRGAEARGLTAVPIPKQTIWERAERALGADEGALRRWIDELRRAVGPPWAEDQKLAALAAWVALAQSRSTPRRRARSRSAR